ncbi:MAG: DHHA1 domain-containing protein, partial [Actinobacteria bacterium]|nr:DHHA1 domain-containing protein [Actinomycetota bacterium]
MLALTLGLGLTGKKVDSVLTDGVPARYRFLPGAPAVVHAVPATVDLLVAVDCSAIDRMGIQPDRLPLLPGINIDHHATNTRFAEANLVAAEAAATAEVIYDLAPVLGLPIDARVATNLLAGIVTDTIGFRTSNVTPGLMRKAVDLIERGAPLSEVYERGLNRHSFNAIRFWGRGLASLEQDGGIVWATLTQEDRRASAYPGNDDADLINLLGTIDGQQVALIFVEQPGGKTKVSWRCREGWNVARVAEAFGGGGHELAAGATLDGP